MAAAMAAALLLLIAAFPLGLLKGVIEGRLSARVGRPVTIAALTRREWLSFSPTLELRGLRVPQPAGFGAGELAAIDAASVRVPVWPLLLGRLRPRAITIERGRIALIRTADGRTNAHGGGGGSGGEPLDRLTIGALQVSYRDARRDRSADVTVASDTRGLRIGGTGTVRGAPVRIMAEGPGIAGGAGRVWPFAVRIAGDRLDLAARGTMARPLDTQHMHFHVYARADDLRRIDAVIEAGLFGTRDVALRADVERAPGRWSIRRVAGTIGGSRLSGDLTVMKADGRNRIDGAVVFDRLDFADLSSDAGNARGAALERRIGLRLVPNTLLDIGGIAHTDGRVAITVKYIFSAARPTALAWAKGVVTLDHRLLTAFPVTLGLTHGRIAGRVVVDQRGGPPAPMMHFDLKVSDTTLVTLVAAAAAEGIDAPVDGRVRLSGRGRTIRAAIGASSGWVGLVAHAGVLPARVAAGLGFDVGRVLTAGGEQARLRCGVLGLRLRGGIGQAAPLLIDTEASVARGVGSIRFPDEALALALTGAPKRSSLLRLEGAVQVDGTIRAPRATVPPKVKSVGNFLHMIGRAITGKQAPLAADLDCAALSARVLR